MGCRGERLEQSQPRRSAREPRVPAPVTAVSGRVFVTVAPPPTARAPVSTMTAAPAGTAGTAGTERTPGTERTTRAERASSTNLAERGGDGIEVGGIRHASNLHAT